jgi:hypothetical protein
VCWNCQKDIWPELKVQVGDREDREPEYTTFLHPINMRYMLEDILQIDINYRSLKQVDVGVMREHYFQLYWNLIWYFCHLKLPYEFMIPYELKAIRIDLSNAHIKVKTQIRFDEMVERCGLQYIQYM